MTPTVTLETKCWKHDWKRILDGERLRLLVERNAYPFSEKILMINNVKNYSVVSRHAERAIQQGWISKYIIVEEHAAEALDFFSISRGSLGLGYRYSIAELVGIFLCRSDFLLHYAGDCMPAATSDWVSRSVRLMSQDSRIKVCNLHPGEDPGGEKHGLVDETDDFYIGQGFSDQCYLVRTENFRQRIYNESHPASARYPRYGGELFEKRVDSWLRNNGHLAAIYKHAHYIHKNWPLPPHARLYRRLRKTKWFRRIYKWVAH
ncbi:MAG: hypothetical protein ABSH11_01570 [Verrucomicrobiota bacterium]|jgi:hypothetical protein